MRVLLLLLGLIVSVTSFGQTGSRDLFEPLVNRPDAATSRSSRESWYRLDEPRLRWALSKLDARGETQPVVLWLPDPDGELRPFAVSRSEVMAPELAAQFPEIETFQGQAVDGSRATLRFELSPVGFTAMTFVPGRVQLIEPDAGTGDYVSFARERREGDAPFRCSVTGEPLSDKSMPVTTELQRYAQSLIHARPKASGPTLRTYRTAVAATVEYTASFGGTVLGAMRGIATAINRVNQVYETEIGVRLVLIPNNAAAVYTVEPDPYTNNDGVTLLGENQTNLDGVIGNANYDVGHVFSTGGGGIAALGSICSNTNKARGVTGAPSPNLDPFWVDYVAHEIGHQLNAPHTFNATTTNCGGGNRSAANAYEVGSGSTIMAYAGICGTENLQANSDPFFHVRSLDTIHTFVQSGGGATCGSTSPTGNQFPIVNAVANRTIPARTPFALTASATDPNGDPLSYSWEQFDLDPTGSTAATVNQDNGLRPLFRSFDATSSPTRLFPRLANILSGTQTIGEVLPTTNRSLNFRVTVRDNRPGGGGVQWTGTTAPPVAQTTLTVVDTGAAFAVTGLDSATTWAAGSAQTVTWNVAGTTAAPISCANVRIDWSTDNGNSGFPTVLLASTPNDGTQGITVPSQGTSAGRVRVGCADNIFFDINNAAITVTGGNAAPTLTLPAAAVTYVSTGGAVILDATATVADSDSANFDGGALTLTLSNNAEANDRLEIRNQGNGAGQIGVSGSNVQFGGTSIGSFSGGVGSVPLVVQFNASATPAAAQALLRNITYRSVTQVLGTLPRTVTAQVADGDGGVSIPVSESVNISFTDRTIAYNFDDSDANNLIAVGDPITYTIRHTRDIDLASVSAADFDNVGTATFVIDSITEPSAGTLSVQLLASTTGTLILRIPASATINDVGGPGQILVPAQDENTVSVVTPLVLVSRTVTTNGGVVQPNSCNSFDAQLRNEAATTATGISGLASSSTAAAPIAQASSAFANAASGATVGNSTPFQFSVAPDAVCGSTINAEIQLNYGGPTGPTVLPVSFQIGALGTVLSQNFDGVTAPALPSGWTTSQTGATPPPAFATTTTGANTAPNVAFTNGAATVASNSLVTPAVVFPAGSYNGRLSLQTAWNFESGAWDGGVIEVSTDNGTTWLDVTDPAIGGSFIQGGYNGTIQPSTPNPLSGRPGFVNTQATYQAVTVQFPPSLNGQTLRFRFRGGWDDSAAASNPNWRIDGVVIQAGIACTAGGGICAANQPSRLAFASQPSNAAINAAISPAVSVRILDSLGNPTSSTATVNLAIASNPGAATLSGSSSAAAVAGLASFANLSLNQPGSGYTLSASSPGLTGATSTAFNVAGVTVTPTTGLVTTEAGGTASFTVVLASQPTANVTIGLSSSDITEGTVSPSSLTFTSGNWSTPQTVTVTGVDDLIVDGNVGYTIVTAPATSTDPNYSGFNAADVSVSNTDNDVAGVTVTQSGGNTAVTEGGATDTYTLVLTSQPTANVTVAVSPNAQLTATPSPLTFTSANWNQPQTVTVTAVNDAVAEGAHSGTVTHAVTSADTNYNGLTVAGVTATITDNDNVGVTVTPTTGLTTTEAGGTATFTVVLTSQPTADVSIGLSSSDPTEGTVSPTSLTFTAANWNAPRTVTVTGADDVIVDGNVGYTIVTAAATSTDSAYAGFNAADVSVSNTDNDIAGVTVTPTTGLTTTEAGGTASFTVVLNTQPSANVTIGLSSNDITEGTVAPISLTFTTANWNSPQAVTVTGADDPIVDGNVGYTIVTAPVISADPAFAGFNAADVSVSNTDNDVAGVTVTQSGGNTAVTEGGATDTYTLVLTSQPTANVTVAVNPNAQLTATPSPLTFTPATWNQPQTVTVSAVNDAIAEGTHSGSVTHTVTSADGNYNGLSVSGITATITDNDNVGVTVTPTTGLTTTESGGTATFTVVLTSQPSADVTIGLSSSDPTEGTVSPTSLTFTTANWNAPRTVTVTGADDLIVDGNVGYTIVTAAATSTDSAYAGFNAADVSVTNTDNDVAGVTVTPTTGLTTTEAGGTATFTVVLNIQPSADVTIGLSSSDPTEGTVSPTSLTFTAANWNSPRTVTVTGADDQIVDGSVAYSIVTAAATSTDPAFAGFNAADVSVSNTDNDVAGVTVTPTTGLTTTEAGGTATFTVVLSAQPIADVTIGLSSNDPTEGAVSPTSLTFTTANWNAPRTVTVTGADDLIVDGSVAYSIVTAAATSTDPAFAGFNAADVSVSNTDNDVAGVTVSPTSGLTTTEAGGTATFTVVLSAQPTADVTVGLSSSDLSEGTVSPSILTFTSGNWSTPRTVTVTGADDPIVDGSVGYTIVTAAATSTDPAFAGINPADVSVSNTDNDGAGVTVTQSSGNTAVTEGGATDSYTLVLTSQPTANVTVAINPNAQLTTSPTSAVFTPANWNQPQSVTVTAVNDAIAEGTHSGSVTHTVTSADTNYGGLTVAGVTATITDNDNPGVTVTQTGGSTNVTEGGATDTYTLVLTSQPIANVVITLASGTQLTATPSPLTFTSANWNQPQTVTVAAVDDAIAEGTHNGSVTHTVTSADANYGGRLVDSVSATITDNDVAGVTVTQSGGNTAVTEGGATDTLSVVLTSQPLADVTVTITPNAQLTATPSPLVFTSANWNVAQIVSVTAVNDVVVEGTHNGTLGFAVASTDPAYGALTLPSITAAVTDNDTAVVSFAPASVSQSEATTPMAFTVTLSNPVASGVTVKVDSTDGTAAAGVDYTAVLGGSVTFAPNSTTAQTVNVAVTNDALDEDNETFSLTLSGINATGDVSLGAASSATGTIEDDDALPVLSVANVSQAEGNAVNTLTFTVNLTPVSGRAVSFTRATVDGSAVSTGPNADFVAIAASTVTIPAGQTQATIPVTINGDTVFEGDQSFSLSLSGVTNATPNDLAATATLTEDDQQPTTTTITADLPDPSVVGQPYPVTVDVRAQTLSPQGAVSITDGTGASCNATLTAGTAPVSTMTCTLTSTSAGAKTLTASYTPASSAFAASTDTEAHQVNAAATSLVLLGPARARIGTVATYTAEISVTAPGAGTPAGTVTVSAGSNSCTITLPTTTPSCGITYTTLGSRSVSAVFAPSNGNFVGSTATPVQTLVFASADIGVTKTNGVNAYRPGDLLVYTVVVRNTGPDAALQVRIRDVAPAGLTNVAWTCQASGGAVCPDDGGTGTLDHVAATLPTGGTLTYAYSGNVSGRPAQIVNVAEVSLPVETTIEDPNPANNSATDTDLLDDLFTDGFEAPGINAESGGVRLAGASLRSTLDEVARVSVRLSDIRGEALRVYARVVGGELQVALALRGADGSLRLGAWQATTGEPELTWTATPAAGGYLLSSAELR